jgi:hypothetical protein
MEHPPPFSASHEHPDEPVYGPLQPAPRRFPRVALAGGLMTALALGGAGIAYAAGSGGSSPATPAASTSPSTTVPSNSPQVPGKWHRGFGGGLGLPGLGLPGVGGKVLYGQATIQQPDGTLKTVEYQAGTVSNVSSTSITVSSGTNGSYTHTYKVDPTTVVDSQAGGISTVTKGDQVRVIATQQNGSDTAVNIVDATKIQSSRSGFGFGAGKNGSTGTGGTSTNPAAGSAGAIFGDPGAGGPSGPGGPGFGAAEAQ